MGGSSLAIPTSARDRCRSAPTSGEDPDMLARVARGDHQAMRECIDQYGSLIWSLARQYCSIREEAEDAVQEIFLAIWRNAGRYDATRGRQVAFVAMIARRRLIDGLRRRKREADRLTRLADRARVTEWELDDGIVHDDESSERVRQAMDNLSDVQRRLLRLSIQGGMTHDQIAEYSDMPVGTVKTHLRRGLLRLREILSPPSKEVGEVVVAGLGPRR
jgi:RNA polymerase sigma-70 factor (ECF subfamily)